MSKRKGIESTIAEGVIAFRSAYPHKVASEKPASAKQSEILSALEEFMECVRYLNTRRTKSTVLSLSSEADVQDALYLMLRPWIKDLRYEEPTEKAASRFSIPDLLVPSANLVIEVKYVRDRKHGKDISKELHDDIEMYRHLPYCQRIVFFIYDPDSFIPSLESLGKQICIMRSHGGKDLHTDLVVKP